MQSLIKDSAGRKMTIIQGDNPNLELCLTRPIVEIFLKKDTAVKVTLYVCGESAPSIFLGGTVYVLFSNNDGAEAFKSIRYFNKKSYLSKKLGLAQDIRLGQDFEIGYKAVK